MAQKKINTNSSNLNNRLEWLQGIYQAWQSNRLPSELYETYEDAYEEFINNDMDDVIQN